MQKLEKIYIRRVALQRTLAPHSQLAARLVVRLARTE